MHGGAPEEADPKALFKPLRKAWDRFPTFNPQLMGAMQRGHKIMVAQGGRDISTLPQATALTHRARQKLLQNADRFGPPDSHQQAAMMNGNAGKWRDFGPDIPGAARATPCVMFRLASYGDKAEITNAGTIRLGVPVQHCNLEAAAGSMQGMGKPNDTCANDKKIEFLFHMLVPGVTQSLLKSHRLKPQPQGKPAIILYQCPTRQRALPLCQDQVSTNRCFGRPMWPSSFRFGLGRVLVLPRRKKNLQKIHFLLPCLFGCLFKFLAKLRRH
jgi:hypothetical protein